VKKPTIHLICSAHLDPVWQWRWEEGAAEALATFRTAVDILREHDDLIFNHNEAVLYRWVEELDPRLFRDIQKLVAKGRWSVSGGWYLQPDVNLPGLESLIRQIAEGRRYFRRKFGAKPRVAYNFDSFGHGGGLPQVLLRAGYAMYIHMRPQAAELDLPSDLFRWKGVDGSEILAYRIAVGLYHTERDNMEKRLREGTTLALKLGRDVPVFWGIGDHGGGPTREDLKTIDAFKAAERRVRVVHSTPDKLYEALKAAAKSAPMFEGDLQRVFTGCYTSLSRLKRLAPRSLGLLTQTEALSAAAWWMNGQAYPEKAFREAWNAHLFNDFHDILSGSCTEPAERDALALYGKAGESVRRLRLSAAASLNRGASRPYYIPVTALNANPSCPEVPVEVECMADYRPFWKGKWRLRLFAPDGSEVPSQEEQPEALLPFNGWRRKLCFMAGLPGIGAAHYEVRAFREKAKGRGGAAPAKKKGEEGSGPRLTYRIDPHTGLIKFLGSYLHFPIRSDIEQNKEDAERVERGDATPNFLAGPLMQSLVIDDDADSWGTGRESYRAVAGVFKQKGGPKFTASGPVRSITESVFVHKKSQVVLETVSYPNWPVLEFRLRITWNEERRRLKLSIPTAIKAPTILAEIPGGAIDRPADGRENVHGRWLFLQGLLEGKEAAFGVVSAGQNGFDFANGEVRLSVLRSAAYCHERGFKLGRTPARKFADLGVHEVRVLITAGDPDRVRRMLPGLADWLSAPPYALAHLPIGVKTNPVELLNVEPQNIRLTACKRSWDGEALVVRLHEAGGIETAALLSIRPHTEIRLNFKPFEIKTVRIERSGRWREVALIEES